jgi:hypothetical protein
MIFVKKCCSFRALWWPNVSPSTLYILHPKAPLHCLNFCEHLCIRKASLVFLVFISNISEVCVSNICHDFVNIVEILYIFRAVYKHKVIAHIKTENSPACFSYFVFIYIQGISLLKTYNLLLYSIGICR